MDNIIYQINILLQPEKHNNKDYFFWCILKQEEDNVPYNCAHGWAESVELAAKEAYSTYVKQFS